MYSAYMDPDIKYRTLSMNSSETRITKRQMAFRGMLFLALLYTVLYVTFRVLWLWDSGYSRKVFEEFYDMPRHSIDAVCFGSSGIREYFISVEGFHRCGAAIYNLGTSNQPFAATKYLIREVLKTQDPQVFVIDLRGVTDDVIVTANIRKVTDSMRFSANRKELIDVLLSQPIEIVSDETLDPMDFYFSFTTYHRRWENLRRDDFGKTDTWMGYSINTETDDFEGEPLSIHDERVPLPECIEEVLTELMAELETLDQKVLFTITPAWYDKKSWGMMLSAVDRLNASGYDVLVMSPEAEETELLSDRDFRENDHVNTYGAMKVTDYLADYLSARYDLPDHRGDEKYRRWETEYAEFAESLEKSSE